MANGARNKQAGSSFERYCVHKFIDAGFQHVKTSRLVSRHRDAQKIDLAHPDELEHGRFPYNVQCKTTTTLSYATVMEELPIVPGIKNVVLHRATKKAGTKFMVRGMYAFMHMEDFFQLVTELEELKKNTTNEKTGTD
jgi:hypothetical protein